MAKKKILIIFNGPINSITDLKNYIFFSNEIYNIYYIGYNGISLSSDVDNVNIISLDGNGSGFLGRIKLFLRLVKSLSIIKPDVIYIPYFLGCSIFRIFHKKCILDIRSSTIHLSGFIRFVKNRIMLFESLFFKYRFVISAEVNDYIGFVGNYDVVPIGSSAFGYSIKKFNKVSLLYVGTFHLRNLSIFIEALSIVYNSTDFDFDKFTIIGFGSEDEISLINYSIEKSNLANKIFFLGEIRPPEIFSYFKNHNVGVSFVPNNAYFYYQPPTKTCEYLMSGMAVMATPNSLNHKLIDSSNGVIFEDTVEGCIKGLEKLYNSLSLYKSASIVDNPNLYTWDKVVNLFFIPSVEKIINE
jgi:hypothetical protein